MEPAFMILGNSVGVWAAIAAASPTAISVHDVPLPQLHAALVKAGQVLLVPVPPPKPPAVVRYDCRKWSRCVQVLKPPSTKGPTCDGKCTPLAAPEWLANTEAFELVLNSTSGGAASIIARPDSRNTTRWLKKSELHSEKLPAALKLLVPQGHRVQIKEMSPVEDDGYWLVTTP
jgi:hypothetical protein